MNIKDQQEIEEELPLTTGQQLCQAREKLGLSRKEIAEKLCLRQVIIKDIENDENSLGLAETFIKGYIRAYARHVNISEEQLNIKPISYLFTDDIAPQTPLKSLPLNKRSTRRKRDSWLMLITWIIVIVLVGLTGLWWWQNHKLDHQQIDALNKSSTIKLTQAQNEGRIISNYNNDNVLVLPKPPVNEVVDNKWDHSNVINSLPTSALLQFRTRLFPDQKATLTEQAKKEIQAAASRVYIEFIDDCWVNISDRIKGRRHNLFKGIKRKGETLTIEGTPPYTIILGNPYAVKMTFAGQPVKVKNQFTLGTAQ